MMLSQRVAALACCAVLAATPAAAQKLGHGGGAEISVWRVAAALLLCLALAVGGAFALRYRQRGEVFPQQRAARRLQVVETIRMRHQVDLALVRCDDREFLVATSPHGVRFGPDVGA